MDCTYKGIIGVHLRVDRTNHHGDRKIRVGILGASMRNGWGRDPHIPALRALPGFEITAVSTSRQETADETAKHFGIPHAFADPYKMLQQPDVDLVSICVRVPFHHQLGMAPGSRRGFLSTSRSSTCGWLKAFTKESPSAQTSIWPSNATSCLTRFRRRRTPGSARFSSDDRPTASRPED